MSTDVVDVLTRARELVAAGWVKGNSRLEIDGRMHYCASGAILEAAQSPIAEDEALRLFHGLVSRRHGCRTIPSWNDAYVRTQADVLAAFDRAIELARADR